MEKSLFLNPLEAPSPELFFFLNGDIRSSHTLTYYMNKLNIQSYEIASRDLEKRILTFQKIMKQVALDNKWTEGDIIIYGNTYPIKEPHIYMIDKDDMMPCCPNIYIKNGTLYILRNRGDPNYDPRFYLVALNRFQISEHGSSDSGEVNETQ